MKTFTSYQTSLKMSSTVHRVLLTNERRLLVGMVRWLISVEKVRLLQQAKSNAGMCQLKGCLITVKGGFR